MTDLSGIPRRPRAEVARPDGTFRIEDFTDSLRLSLRNEPHPVELLVGSWFFDGEWQARERAVPEKSRANEDAARPDSWRLPGDISVFLVVTDVRVIWVNPDDGVGGSDALAGIQSAARSLHPQFEVEGWLLDPPRGVGCGKMWVRCSLRIFDDATLVEGDIYLLGKGEQRGTDPSGGM